MTPDQPRSLDRSRAATEALSLLLAALAGVAVFILAFGIDWLDPRHVTWLLRGDWSQHYLGWESFRHDDWRWPPGRNLAVAAPMGTTVVFTDSLPLLALALKPFSEWLPQPMQYQGPWMATSWALQGVFAYTLLHRLLADRAIALLGMPLFLLLPSLFFRIGHDTLTAQWLILAALLLYTSTLDRRTGTLAALLIAIAVLVHAYLALMVLAIWGAWWISQLSTRWHLAPPGVRTALAVYPLPVLAVTFGIMGLAGYFAAGPRLSAPGFGTYSLNLNAFINPMDQAWGFLGPGVLPEWSRVLPPLPRSHPNQYEGFNYLGLGILLLTGLAALLWLVRRPPFSPRLAARSHPAPGWPRLPHLWLALAPLTLWAITNRVGIGSLEWTYPLPWPLSDPQLQSVFRSTGRFAWPLVLVLLALVIVSLARRLPRPALMIVLPFAALLQAWDQYPAWQTIRAAVDQPPRLPLQSPAWEDWLERADHVAIVPPVMEKPHWMIHLGALALSRGMTMNSFLISRYDPGEARAQARQQQRALVQNGPRPRTLYVLAPGWRAGLPPRLDRRIRAVDGLRVLPPEPVH